MVQNLKRYEKVDNTFILRVPTKQLTVMYDPHRLEEHLSSGKDFPNPDSWEHTLLYTAFISVNDLFVGKDVLMPMGKNPRNQNTKSSVSNNIASSLINEELDSLDENQQPAGYPTNESFYINNRGIAVVAHRVNQLKNVSFMGEDTIIYPEVLEIHMDETEGGNIDGGHTYKIILEQVQKMKKREKKVQAFVRLEINVNLRDVTTFAAARNTNAAVKEASIMNSRGEFDTLKILLADLPFYERIAYRQNDKGIPIENIVEYIELFNQKKSPLYEPVEMMIPTPFIPKQKWGASKKEILKFYSEEINSAIVEERLSEYDLMEPIIKDIFWLYTEIEKNLHNIYNQYANGKRNANFAALAYVTRNETKEKSLANGKKYRQITTYGDGEIKEENAMPYVIDKGLVIPIAGMFRMLLDKDTETGRYHWVKGLDVKQHAGQIIGFVIEEAMKSVAEEGPDNYAKDRMTWKNNLLTMSQYRMQLSNKGAVPS
ncbi:AIPR family protein [Priestia megaterium]|uniref:AIPR family protein n=1 Tax=Priestia megaterium TaxID=1404 RepID=UPI0025AFAC0E|nr:AIPR family protein [Priestia megaterium]MDN3233111.1 AIPR family protein [Priestia megaterium]